ncbi:MAG TPA: SAM-dependent chlorinase/fluorinase [Kiritimatiellia bacterium]|nr:SAM-dependent chlorinase/fluorinase [Kiritimatiellia bacterium]HMP00144.1 SAM-dependent chlorinase/fluorinase [Kiritimatiellia bacterium]HMP96898.1 SAM-dependent chlorinase/fluorinase [Kiritimatiellia bacterium]
MIVLMSDFGMADGYVAAMKGVIASVSRDIPILDATHEIAPQDIAGGAWALANYLPYFPPGTIHVAVVDPGVGTGRSLVLVEAGGQRVFAPDNGLLSIWLGSMSSHSVKALRPGWHRPGPLSATFHGRDILAYAAALLAVDQLPADALQDMDYPLMRLPESMVNLKESSVVGQIMHVDRFGNAISGITRAHMEHYNSRRAKIVLPYGAELPLKQTYGDVDVGKPLALVNSSDHLEVAIRGGNASLTHGLIPGSQIEIRFS